jgi:tetratricopeptide (TPR) repeat protein
MPKLAQLRTIERSPRTELDVRAPRLRTRFYAFLSYSHKDKDLADWLHRELEEFRVPHSLAGKLTANGVVPHRLTPVFRDQHDLSAGGELGDEIKAALAASQFLVVLCSPTAAKSRWMNEEIESFKRTRPEGCVLAAIVAGEPFASEMPSRKTEECFPPALRYRYDRRGQRTLKRAEPLAADFRKAGEGQRLAFLKLVAGMLGVGLDELVQRDATRRQRRFAYFAAASLAGMAVTSALAVTAFQARNEAREQRREAESLVAFMVGDLKDKLEPIGRLDALDGVGVRVIAYYGKQDASELSDAALTQRSKALSLMAQVADARGNTKIALKLYQEAMAGTTEAMRRSPADPEAIFDHAQSVFYVGEIARAEGDLRTAEKWFREYQRLASRMSALQPDSMKYRMEQQYADFNLGVVLSDQRRFADAVKQFDGSLRTMEAISAADPTNLDYRQSIAESLTWLADAEHALGNYDAAIAHRRRNLALYSNLITRTGDVHYRQQLIPALRSLGNLYEEREQVALAEAHYRTAVARADSLTGIEPDNAVYIDYGIRARLDLARLLLTSGRRDEASIQASTGCQSLARLLGRGAVKPDWRREAASCDLLQAHIALAAGAKDQAASLAQHGLNAVRTAHSVDKIADAYRLAGAYRIVGDVERDRGDLTAARAAWLSALAAVPPNVAELPDEMASHATILQRLGRSDGSRRLTTKLNSMGYRAKLAS